MIKNMNKNKKKTKYFEILEKEKLSEEYIKSIDDIDDENDYEDKKNKNKLDFEVLKKKYNDSDDDNYDNNDDNNKYEDKKNNEKNKKDEEKNEEIEMKEMETEKDNKENKLKEIRKDLENNINFFSDFLQQDYHKKSINMVNENYSIEEIDSSYRENKFLKKENNYEQVIKKLLFFVEECDSLQGFQIFTDTNNSWASITSDYIDMIKDEIGLKQSIITFGCSPKTEFKNVKEKNYYYLNNFLSFNDLYDKSNIFIPFSMQNIQENSFSNLNYKPNNLFHSSSMIANSIDSFTIPFRKKKDSFDMRELINIMNLTPSMRLSNIKFNSPYVWKKDDNLFNIFTKSNQIHKNENLVNLTNNNPQNNQNEYDEKYEINKGLIDSYLKKNKILKKNVNFEKVYSHSSTIRGISQIKLFDEDFNRNYYKSENELDKLYFDLKNHDQFFNLYLRQTKSFNNFSQVFSQSTPVPLPFPDYFNKNINSIGQLDTSNSRNGRVYVQPTFVYSQTSQNLLNYIHLFKYFINSHSNNLLNSNNNLIVDDVFNFNDFLDKLNSIYSQ
jgi:hypothetical protein